MEIKCILNEYPKVHEIRDNSGTIIILNVSPFSNCQTASLGHAGAIKHFSPAEVYEFIKLIQDTIRKTQYVVDLLECDQSRVMDKLNPYIEWEKSIEYVNSNTGSPMILSLIKFKDLINNNGT